MASSTLPKHQLPFLIFPSLAPVMPWRVVATESNRTISFHKHLVSAVEKAERLNVQVIQGFLDNMPSRITCEAHILSQYGVKCVENPTVTDLESEVELCLEHFKLLQRGEL